LKTIQIFHQNIRGLRFKFYELLCHLEDKLPLIFCFTELIHLNFDAYLSAAHYCRNYYKKGGACILVHKSLNFKLINLDQYCQDKDIEACPVSVSTTESKISILTIYRVPTGNYDLFWRN
jgi:hypothetical protein